VERDKYHTTKPQHPTCAIVVDGSIAFESNFKENAFNHPLTKILGKTSDNQTEQGIASPKPRTTTNNPKEQPRKQSHKQDTSYSDGD